MLFSEWSISKILKQAQIQNSTKTYTYNQMDRINSKPALQSGSENLREYPLFLQLHRQLCDPKEIIKTIEDYAASREAVEWVKDNEYMGSFVISSIDKLIKNEVKGTIIYAEVSFTLLENPVEIEQQKVDLDKYDKYGETSNKFKDFGLKVKNSITENIKETITSGTISDNLSDSAKEILSSVTNGVLNDIAGGKITEIYNTCNNYADIIENDKNLNFSDVKELAAAITSIPDLMLNSAMRKAVR